MRPIPLIFTLLLPLTLAAQEFDFVLEPQAFPVTMESGWQPYSPWAGGEEYSCPEFCDIDNDGDLDAFIGNSSGKVTFHRNQGTAANPDFIFVTRDFGDILLSIDDSYGYSDPVFCDIDNDGDYDFFSSSLAGLVHYWENQGTPEEAYFVHITDSLENIDVPQPGHLDLVDIDADGDFDLLIGDNAGHIQYFQNIGTPSVFDFEIVTTSLDSIDVGSKASPCFIDIDSDGDYDLFIGEEYGKTWYYRNDGDSVNYDFTFVTSYFDSIDVGKYSSPDFADIDGDGDYDLFVGRNGDSNYPYGDLYHYENTGTSESPDFEFIAKSYLTIDLGYGNIPRLIDIDADGLLDIFVNTMGVLRYYQNIGSVTEPAFIFADDAFQEIQVVYPVFVDIDADGDYDLICGESAIPGPPSIELYLNHGTPEEPVLRLENENFITNPDFFVNIQPSCADIDADGDYDLFITDDNGNTYFYRNDGSSGSADYILITNRWQGIYYPYPHDSSKLMGFADVDDDSDFDLFMRNYEGDNIRFYRNNGTAQNPIMECESESVFPEYDFEFPHPFFVDIDSDGDYDIFVGESGGGIWFFRNHENPFQAQLTITIQDNDIILTWGSIANAVEYQIFYQNIPYFTPEGIPQAVVLPPDTVWADEGGVNEWKRYYRMITQY